MKVRVSVCSIYSVYSVEFPGPTILRVDEDGSRWHGVDVSDGPNDGLAACQVAESGTAASRRHVHVRKIRIARPAHN